MPGKPAERKKRTVCSVFADRVMIKPRRPRTKAHCADTGYLQLSGSVSDVSPAAATAAQHNNRSLVTQFHMRLACSMTGCALVT